MSPDEIANLAADGADVFNEMLRRPWDCSDLEMELKTAMGLKDVVCCRELLREKGRWIARFKGHELCELMGAAIAADDVAIEFVGLLLKSGVPAHSVYDQIGPNYQHTPLVTAARHGRSDLIQMLVAAGADVFWASPTGANALSETLPSKATQAPRHDSPEMSRVRDLLMNQGVRIDPLCADSKRKMCWASSNPVSWPDVPTLLELGIPLDATGWTPFMFSLALGNADARAVAGMDSAELDHRDAWGRTPLLLAVVAGDLAMARAMHLRGSDLHAQGRCGATALHLAAQHNHCHLIEWLITEGLPIGATNDFGNTPLHSAVECNRVDAARLLIKMGATVCERDANGYELIHGISFKQELTMLELLLSAGADVNAVSGGGSWPLHDACQAGDVAAVSYLLQMGANPNLTSTGKTALFAAVSSDSLECVRLLIESGVEVNATDVDGWSCLFHLQSEKVAQYLLEHGADASLADQCGGLPEDWKRVPMAVRAILKTSRVNRQ